MADGIGRRRGMKKISDLLHAYIISFWIMALLIAMYAGDKMEDSWLKLIALLVAVFFFVMGYKGAQAIGPLKEMEERK